MKFKRALFLAGLTFLPLLIGATSPNLVLSARNVTTAVTAPFLKVQSQVVHFSKSQFHTLAEWTKLHQINAQLKAQVSELKSELAQHEELKQEAARLRALLALKEQHAGSTVAARVIARDPSHWSHFIVIDKGIRHGLREHTPLIHPDGLVGKAVAVGQNWARAILLTDSASRVSAMDEKTRDVGLIEGTGYQFLKMVYLARDSQIQVGDTIISSGLGGVYPKGVPIGRVHVVGEEDGLSLYALVKPFVPFQKLEEVLCDLSPTKE